MWHDEARSAREVRELQRQRWLSEPVQLLDAYEDLQRRYKDLAKKEGQAAALKRKRDSLAKERDELNRKLGEATAALAAYRAETSRLKKDLVRVRTSHTMKIGRFILAPFHAAKASLKTVRKTTKAAARPQLTASASATARDSAQKPVVTATGIDTHPVPERSDKPLSPSQRPLSDLIADLEDAPNASTLERVVHRLWYQRGEIDATYELIEKFSEAANTAKGDFRILIARIKGTYRLKTSGVSLPPRSSGYAYINEPNRVMYCVHSTPVYNSNGYSTRTRGVAKGLKDAGADVRVVARVGYPWDSATDKESPTSKRSESTVDGVSYVHRPGANLNRSPIDQYLSDAADAFVCEALLQRPSVIQSASNYFTALPALIAARRLGVPFVYEVRGLWEVTEAAARDNWESTERFRFARDLETLVASEADAVLAITSQLADELVRCGVAREKITVAPNCVDPSQFIPLPKDEVYAAASGILADVPVIGFAGSIVAYEGLKTLLEASSILVQRGVDHQVVLAGSGSDLENLRKMRDASKLSSVLFLGRRPNDEMPRLISTFDVVCCPRISDAVTEMVSPLKPLEAFATETPVVLSDVAPHRDLAADGKRALLFEAGNPDSLADALQELLDDPDRRADMGRAGRMWTLDERNWAALGGIMTEVHRQAIVAASTSGPVPGRQLADLRIALIADEFTTSTLSATCRVTELRYETWRQQLEAADFDLLFVESAWSGLDNSWNHHVGYYGAEENAELFALINRCRDRGIPSVFWNKEDPVHFNRFRRTAARFDHVFTTDRDMVMPYLETATHFTKSVSSLPFYAQPTIHNPLAPNGKWESTVAYAGTYYGERYADRSKQLYRLLKTASNYGLVIYDRQANIPDSPYHFPKVFHEYVRGGLPYSAVLDDYKCHIAHLNVNSVTESPTMFSRRVVEVAASGGVVLSGPGRGIAETLGSVIPATSDESLWAAYLQIWSRDAVARNREAWRQLRAVYRAHTVDTALTLVARTAGIPVRVRLLPGYAVDVTGASDEAIDSLRVQSVLPVEVVSGDQRDKVTRLFSGTQVAVVDHASTGDDAPPWIARLTEPIGRTHFEDLLTATRFGVWDAIGSRTVSPDDAGVALAVAVPMPDDPSQVDLRRNHPASGQAVELRIAGSSRMEQAAPNIEAPSLTPVSVTPRPQTVLVAGHDLKFAGGILAELERRGHKVLIEKWQDHNAHDEEMSVELLDKAKVVFCEWGLGNAQWYSNHVEPGQRLVVRVHSQELRRPYLRQIKHGRVDQFIFVSELIRRAATESHKVPAKQSVVIPNYVDCEALDLEKVDGAEFNLGLVGMIPRSKRLDLAIDLVERLLQTDSRYKLFVKGKTVDDYPWMKNRPDELAYYESLDRRIEELCSRYPGAVQFDGYDPHMAEWFRKIGVAISVSDFESFHLTLADGAASGAQPVSLLWPGADLIYPREWLCADTDAMVEAIRCKAVSASEARSFVQEHFDTRTVLPVLVDAIVPGQ